MLFGAGRIGKTARVLIKSNRRDDEGRGPMKTFRLAAAAAFLILSSAIVSAQTTLRIGLAEDPDVLDPTLARTYVGRIVFASFCDKLFDIDEKLNAVPQLALGYETAPDGKAVTIKLRPNVKFHDGEKLDADAAKYSLERHMTMAGSFRKPELAAVDRVEVVDPLTIKLELKTPFAPLIAQLIDRAALNQVVFNGEFVPGNQWVNPENSYYQKALPVRKRDVNKAKTLLKEAGITAPFDVDFMVPKGAEAQAVAEVIQAMAADIGINMRIRVTEFATSLKQAEAGEYQAFLLAWSGRSDPDGNVYVFYKCKAPLDYPGYCNPEVDNLLDQSRIPSDATQRKAIYEKLTRIILEDAPILYLYHPRMLIAHTTRLEGYRQMADGLVRVVGLKLK